MTENTEPAYVIQTEDLRRVYKTGSREVHALRGVNLQLKTGRLIALKGRSGSGKTTLLNCIGGLDRPSSGEISVFGQNLIKMSQGKLTLWRRSEVGFIFQSFGLLPSLSAFENVELMLRINREVRKVRRERTSHCLELVGLGKWADHRPYEMSGGQQQRVAIARALANSPQLILADEPTGELDSTTSGEIMTLFQNLVDESKITILMSSHDPLVDEDVDEVLQLGDGEIIEHKVMRDEAHQPLAEPQVERFTLENEDKEV